MKVKGLQKALARSERVKKNLKNEAPATILSEVKEIFEQSQEDVPRQSGELADSGRIVQTSTGARIEYTADYAGRIHEDLTLHHPNGMAKFVERPTLEAKPRMRKRLAEVIKK